jgi:hypothetical protein
MAAGNEMRVSDAEREAAASELREHFASGRLDSEELSERLDRALAAKTRGDLNALFTDLPSSWRSPSSAFGPGTAGPGAGTGPGADDRRQYAGRGMGGSYCGGQGGSWQPGRRAGAGIAMLLFLMPVLMVFGIISVFGIGGGGRPIGIVLILAAFALLRRLLFMIFGRRGRGGSGPRGPRRRRR